MWLTALVIGTSFSCLYQTMPLFVASVLLSFLGLNETARWSYKTNLILCAIVTVVGTTAGVFEWYEMLAIFVLLFIVGGFMLYYRDKNATLLPALTDFCSTISSTDNTEDIVENATQILRYLLPKSEVFVVLSDMEGNLYLPATSEDPEIILKRNGSVVWKTYASGNIHMTNAINVSRDKPLWNKANSSISIPLEINGQKYGVLEVESCHIKEYLHETTPKLQLFAHILTQRIATIQTMQKNLEKTIFTSTYEKKQQKDIEQKLKPEDDTSKNQENVEESDVE